MIRPAALLALFLASVSGFMPVNRFGRAHVTMSAVDVKKAMGIAVLGLSLAGPMMPMPALADGAISKSTVFRARNNYGAKISSLDKAIANSNFGAFDKRASNWFDLFISGANALPGEANKLNKEKETALKADIFAAANAKDSGKLKAAYGEFIKVASLKSEYKNGELGQTDSSGYSPTWGTDRQYIYQR